ncbi:MAG: hypothetical protein ABIP51_04910 [Bacteroidia bacterium]
MKALKVITVLISLSALVFLGYVTWGNYTTQGKLQYRAEAGIALWFFSIIAYSLCALSLILFTVLFFLSKRGKKRVASIK